MNAIVVATAPGRETWLKDCLSSLAATTIPVLSVSLPGYELGKIRWIYEHTDIDQFLFLQDSVVVKDTSWIDDIFSHNESVSLSHHHFFMYMGKYTRKDLANMDFPEVRTKSEAVRYEDEWTSKYAPGCKSLWALHDTDVFEERHGRMNMVLENPYIIKYKGTWHPGMIID